MSIRQQVKLSNEWKKRFFGEDGKLTEGGKRMLFDLKTFAKARHTFIYTDNDGKVDPYALAIAKGRREVYDRIIRFLAMDDISEAEIEKFEAQLAEEQEFEVR